MSSPLPHELEAELVADAIGGNLHAAALVAALKGFRPRGAPASWPADLIAGELEALNDEEDCLLGELGTLDGDRFETQADRETAISARLTGLRRRRAALRGLMAGAVLVLLALALALALATSANAATHRIVRSVNVTGTTTSYRAPRTPVVNVYVDGFLNGHRLEGAQDGGSVILFGFRVVALVGARTFAVASFGARGRLRIVWTWGHAPAASSSSGPGRGFNWRYTAPAWARLRLAT